MTQPTAPPRERILAAARRAAQEQGLEGLRLEDVAGLAGVARPNLYRYFPSKQDLLQAVLLLEVQAIHDERAERVAGLPTAREQLVESLVLGAELTAAGELIPAVAGPGRDGVAGLVAHDPELLALEVAYWSPLLARARDEGSLAEHLDDERVIRWFMSCQWLAVVQPDLVGDDLRAWVVDFVAPPVLRR